MQRSIYAIFGSALYFDTRLDALTQGFSFYVRYFARSVLSYGTIGTFIVLLFWMNYSALVIMVGAVINATLEERKYGTIRSKRTLDHFNDSSVKRFFNWKYRSK